MKLVFASDSFKGTVSSEQTVEFLTKEQKGGQHETCICIRFF